MSNIEASVEVFRGNGSGSFPGLRRFFGVMWVLVVKTSHIGSLSSGVGVEDVEETARRDFFSALAAEDSAVLLIWERSAVDALSTFVQLAIRVSLGLEYELGFQTAGKAIQNPP